MTIQINEDNIKNSIFTILESSMQSMIYYNKLKNVSYKIKQDFINSGKSYGFEKVYDNEGLPVPIVACGTFKYPCGNTDGCYSKEKGAIFLRVRDGYTEQYMHSTLIHEMQHCMDSTIFYSDKQKKGQDRLKSIAYRRFFNPNEIEFIQVGKGDKVREYVRDIIYKLWIHTETNAFIAQIIYKGETFSFFNNLIHKIDYVKDCKPEDDPEFWKSLRGICNFSKMGNASDRPSIQKIKNHFVSQSYHKFYKLEKIAEKKLAYAKSHGQTFDY